MMAKEKRNKPRPIEQLQTEAAAAAFPYYNPLLQAFANNAGIPIQAPALRNPVPQPAAGYGVRPVQPSAGGYGAQPGQPMASIQPVGGASPQQPLFGGFGYNPQQPAGGTNLQEQLAQLRAGAARAGVPGGGVSPQAQLAQQLGGGPQQAGVLGYDQTGIYGQNPADRFRLQQAEEDIGRQANQMSRMLAYRLGQQGIGSSGIGASAQTQLAQGAQQDLSNFRRQLAIQAGQEQERRLMMLAQMMGIGQQQGSQAQQVLAQQRQADASKPSFLQTMAGFAPLFSPIKF